MVRVRPDPDDEEGPAGERTVAGRDAGDDEIELGGESGFLAAIPEDAPAPAEAAGGAGSAEAAVPAFRHRAPSATPIETPAHRDRVVILGRRASGKTVFLSRLYHHLFRGAGGLTAQARDGPSHLRCTAAMEALLRGQWPPATGETSAIDLEIGFPGGVERLVALDYPGEVFRRAFLDEVGGPDVDALLEHVDRAAAVLLLIDPGLARGDRAAEHAEDDFGMIQALRRIRASPGGAAVPVAIVLTKIDANAALVRAAGGLKPFVERTYPALVRAASGVRVFGCAAVRTTLDPLGRRLPQARGEPAGVVEPLAWCLASMGRLRRGELAEARRREAARVEAEARAAEAVAGRRERRILAVVWIVAAVVIAAIAIAAAVILEGRPS